MDERTPHQLMQEQAEERAAGVLVNLVAVVAEVFSQMRQTLPHAGTRHRRIWPGWSGALLDLKLVGSRSLKSRSWGAMA